LSEPKFSGKLEAKGIDMKKMIFVIAVLGSVVPLSAFATVFHCNLQKVPPFGVAADPSKFIREFTFDTRSPADTMVEFAELSLNLHFEGTRILMKVANSKSHSLVSVSANETEIYLQLDDDAVGICLKKDVLKKAFPIE